MSDQTPLEFWKGVEEAGRFKGFDPTIFERGVHDSKLHEEPGWLHASKIMYDQQKGEGAWDKKVAEENLSPEEEAKELSEWGQDYISEFRNQIHNLAASFFSDRTDEQNMALYYMMNVSDNNWSWNAVGHTAYYSITDPISWGIMGLSVVAAPFTGTTSLAGGAALVASRFSAKTLASHAILKGLTTAVHALAKKPLIASTLEVGAYGAASGTYGFVEGLNESMIATKAGDENHGWGHITENTLYSAAFGAGLSGGVKIVTEGGMMGTRALKRAWSGGTPSTLGAIDLPEYKPSVDWFKVYMKRNLNAFKGFTNWATIENMPVNCGPIVRPVLRAMDKHLIDTGFKDKIWDLEDDLLKAIDSRGNTAAIMDRFAKDNSALLADLKKDISTLRAHVDSTFKTIESAKDLGDTLKLHRSVYAGKHILNGLTTDQKDALIKDLQHVEDVIDDLAKGSKGGQNTQVNIAKSNIRRGAKTIENKAVDTDTYRNSVHGLIRARFITDNAYARIEGKWKDGAKAPFEWRRSQERSIQEGYSNTGNPAIPHTLDQIRVDNNSEAVWQREILPFYKDIGTKDKDGKITSVDWAQGGRHEQFTNKLVNLYELGYGHDALYSVDELVRRRQQWKGYGHIQTLPDSSNIRDNLKAHPKYGKDTHFTQWADELVAKALRSDGRYKGAPKGKIGGAFGFNRPNQEFYAFESYPYRYSYRYSGTGYIATPGWNYFTELLTYSPFKRVGGYFYGAKSSRIDLDDNNTDVVTTFDWGDSWAMNAKRFGYRNLTGGLTNPKIAGGVAGLLALEEGIEYGLGANSLLTDDDGNLNIIPYIGGDLGANLWAASITASDVATLPVRWGLYGLNYGVHHGLNSIDSNLGNPLYHHTNTAISYLDPGHLHKFNDAYLRDKPLAAEFSDATQQQDEPSDDAAVVVVDDLVTPGGDQGEEHDTSRLEGADTGGLQTDVSGTGTGAGGGAPSGSAPSGTGASSTGGGNGGGGTGGGTGTGGPNDPAQTQTDLSNLTFETIDLTEEQKQNALNAIKTNINARANLKQYFENNPEKLDQFAEAVVVSWWATVDKDEAGEPKSPTITQAMEKQAVEKAFAGDQETIDALTAIIAPPPAPSNEESWSEWGREAINVQPSEFEEAVDGLGTWFTDTLGWENASNAGTALGNMGTIGKAALGGTFNLLAETGSRMSKNETGQFWLQAGGGLLGTIMAMPLINKLLSSPYMLGVGNWPIVGPILKLGVAIVSFMGIGKAIETGFFGQGDGKKIPNDIPEGGTADDIGSQRTSDPNNGQGIPDPDPNYRPPDTESNQTGFNDIRGGTMQNHKGGAPQRRIITSNATANDVLNGSLLAAEENARQYGAQISSVKGRSHAPKEFQTAATDREILRDHDKTIRLEANTHGERGGNVVALGINKDRHYVPAAQIVPGDRALVMRPAM